jgi:DNA invertase Pin-like site-specific DNA recombinase
MTPSANPYTYLRVSTDRQDVDNQRYGLLEYANRQGWESLHFVEEGVFARTPEYAVHRIFGALGQKTPR